MARSSDSDIGHTVAKSRPINICVPEADFNLMDASSINHKDTNIPHMVGGETYMQRWEVVNTGKLPWTYVVSHEDLCSYDFF